MPEIVVLDGYTLNPGDLSWDNLEEIGNCVVYDRTPPDLVMERALGADIVLTNKTVLDRDTILSLPRLRYIGLLSTGYNVIDLETASRRKIPVTNVPSYSTPSVAQMTFALVLELTQRVGHHAEAVRNGRWSSSAHFSFWDYPLVELEGLTMGLVGLGSIGRRVAVLAGAFGLSVIATRPGVSGTCPETGVPMVTLEDVFRESDIISLHCPLTEKNAGMVNGRLLAMAKPGAFLVNTARGPLIDEEALAAALNEERLAGAGLDVLSLEPPTEKNPLLKAKNCFVTPHIAWATRAARSRLMREVVQNLKEFLAGNSRNVVNRFPA